MAKVQCESCPYKLSATAAGDHEQAILSVKKPTQDKPPLVLTEKDLDYYEHRIDEVMVRRFLETLPFP